MDNLTGNVLGGLGAFKPKKVVQKPAVQVDVDGIIKIVKPYVRDMVARADRDIESTSRDVEYVTGERARVAALERLQIAKAHKAALKQRWGAGIDAYLTGLFSLKDYTHIWAEEHPKVPFRIPGVPYIIGQTTEVEFEIGPFDRVSNDPVGQVRRYDPVPGRRVSAGQYRIMIPLGGAVGDVHWVPMRQPDTLSRHPHHHLGGGVPRTCWGTFAGYVTSLVANGEFVPMIRLCGQFCHVYNPGSPLIHLSSIPFLRLINE
ncbi:hypothetical protein [Aggregatilinea lenta]|uniref:hypothetical protein n=1 Tax=Aggregatilinea lenta TaxID=913108 RepID=UPI000E5A694A|nr:hypothetical protein [Aggregatilinea lenta]